MMGLCGSKKNDECLTWTDNRPEWMAGEEGTERMSKAERQRLEFEAERLRWQEERKKVGQTAQKAANVRLSAQLRVLRTTCMSGHLYLRVSTLMSVPYEDKVNLDRRCLFEQAAMGELLDDDELEQMRREEMEAEKQKDAQARCHAAACFSGLAQTVNLTCSLSKRHSAPCMVTGLVLLWVSEHMFKGSNCGYFSEQALENSEDQSSQLAEPETPPKRGSGQSAESTPMQPPPGFSPNHLFGDADEEPLDLTASLSFLDDNEQACTSALRKLSHRTDLWPLAFLESAVQLASQKHARAPRTWIFAGQGGLLKPLKQLCRNILVHAWALSTANFLVVYRRSARILLVLHDSWLWGLLCRRRSPKATLVLRLALRASLLWSSPPVPLQRSLPQNRLRA